MSRQEILEQMQEVFRETLNQEELILQEETLGEDIEDWDSFAQISVFAALEQQFGVEFSMEEMMEFSTIGKLADVIEMRLA